MKPNNKKIVLHFIAIVICFYFPNLSFSQNTFESIFDLDYESQRAYTIAETTDGNFIIAGIIESVDYSSVCKVDSTGVLQWSKYYSVGDVTAINDLAIDINGNLFVSGSYFYESFPWGYLMKLTPDGDSVWVKRFLWGQQTRLNKIIIDFDHNLAITSVSDYPANSRTMKLININPEGELRWETNIIENDTNFHYSTFGLLQLPDSSFFMSGSYHYSDYNYKPFMARVSATGELLYTRVHELPWPEGSARVNSICPDGNGNVMNCAEFGLTPLVNQGIWMIKTNADGDTLWSKTIADEGTTYWPKSVILCNDGGFAIAGSYVSNLTPTIFERGAFIMRTDSLANPLWTRIYASDKNGFFYEISEASDQGLAATGVASPSPGHQAFYLVKTDTAGLITSTWQPGAVADRLTVGPNPVADVCYVTLPQGCRQLNLLTLQGQTLLTINTTGKSTLELSTNWLPAGLYLLRAETPSGCMIEKILKLKP